MIDETNNNSLQGDNILSDFTDQLLSGNNPNISETDSEYAEMREDQKLVKLIYQLGREGVPDEETSDRIRETLAAEWKTKWPQKQTGFRKPGIFGWFSPKKSEWKSTKQLQNNLTIGIAVITIIVLVIVVFSLPANSEGLPGAANQGGLFSLVIFSLLVVGLGLWWFVTRKR